MTLTQHRGLNSLYCGTLLCRGEGGYFEFSGILFTDQVGNRAGFIRGSIDGIPKAERESATWADPLRWESGQGSISSSQCKTLYAADEDEAGWRTVRKFCANEADVTVTPEVYEVGAITERSPSAGDFKTTPEETKDLVDTIEADPEYDEAWAKPWLREGFRAPTSSAEREALWGPVVGEWTTPDGSQCKEYESGAQLCDSPNGTTFAWVVKDGVAWMQHSDGSKQWTAQPGPRSPRAPPGPGDGSGTTTLYRVIDQEELQDVQQLGDYNLSPHGGGKYFAVTEQGARNFANASINRDEELTLTSVEVPNWFLGENGRYFNDIGEGGAGWSYHFTDDELAEMYKVMGEVRVLGQVNTAPTITSLRPAPNSSTSDRTPTISATVRDTDGELAKENLTLTVDERRMTAFSHEPSTGRLSYTTGSLAYGQHAVKLVVADATGKSTTKFWRFTVARRPGTVN